MHQNEYTSFLMLGVTPLDVKGGGCPHLYPAVLLEPSECFSNTFSLTNTFPLPNTELYSCHYCLAAVLFHIYHVETEISFAPGLQGNQLDPDIYTV